MLVFLAVFRPLSNCDDSDSGSIPVADLRNGGYMDATTRNLMIDVSRHADKIAKLLRKGDVELRKDGQKVKIILVTKKTIQ